MAYTFKYTIQAGQHLTVPKQKPYNMVLLKDFLAVLPDVFSLVLSVILPMTHPGIFHAREQTNKEYY